MKLLDTMVVSELRKHSVGRAHPSVARWADTENAALLFVSSISILEMQIGILRKMRKDPTQGRAYQTWLHDRVMPSFAGRILSIDSDVALRCAELHVPSDVSYLDSLIAATALVHGMTVVTRNEKDFVPMGVKVLNPWKL